MKVAVIGAGPAGLTAAYQLARAGAEVEVFEASPHVGGMSRSIELWDQTVDLGPHRFFSSDARVNRLWLEVADGDYAMVERLTRIYYGKKFFNYPLEAGNALWNLGPISAASCVVSYLKQRMRPTEDQRTFESWVVRRFGRRLFDIFFRSYSEKLWGIGCDQLDEDFAAQRIKKLSLGEAIKNALGWGGKGHRTLVDQFAYPLRGTGMIYERMAEAVDAVGAVHLSSPVKRILHDGQLVTGLQLFNGRIDSYDHVVSTMPITHLIRGLDHVPRRVQEAASQLRFRNTILVYLQVDGHELFPDQWIYVHDSSLKVGRVTNFRNWVPQLYGQQQSSILALEYWCNDDDPDWSLDDGRLISLAQKEIRTTGLVGDAQILDGHVVRVPRCYPVYAKNYRDNLDRVVEYISDFQRLWPIGRYGSFKYNNQDHSILMGMMAAENILESRQNDLWSINTDYTAYQESATITATGLSPVTA